MSIPAPIEQRRSRGRRWGGMRARARDLDRLGLGRGSGVRPVPFLGPLIGDLAAAARRGPSLLLR
eukprot:225363-Pyramimonas_sp.AAC.1